jgi:N-acetyl-alpha-D-glucosaminyl L-malate synthase BshA
MRIGIVCYSTYGGSGVVATELGAALAEKGHQIHFISSSTPFRLATLEMNDNIYFHEVPNVEYPLFSSQLTTLSLATKIRQVVLDEKLDLIHAHYAIPHAASAWMAREMLQGERYVPTITTLHGTDITLVGRSPSFRSVIQFVLQQVDAVTAVSQWLADKTYSNFEPDCDVRVIPNFIDPERFKPADMSETRQRYAKTDEKLVLHISNFRPVKRVQDVVKSFAKIAEKVPAKLLMIGDGPTRECAATLARELGVMDRTWFLGKQNNIEQWLAMADLLLFPSDHESFGLAALEAMSCEVPVIATQSGGLPEVIENGVSGVLCEVGDTEGMAAAGIDLLTNPQKAEAMGKAARQRVIDHFHPDNIVPRYEALYNEVLENRGLSPYESQVGDNGTKGNSRGEKGEKQTPRIAPDFLTA